MKNDNKVNGNANILNEQQEYMRKQVVDLELKARYWKAQWEIKHYSLEGEKLEEGYNELIAIQAERAKKAREEALEQMEKIKKAQEEGQLAGDIVPQGVVPDGVQEA